MASGTSKRPSDIEMDDTALMVGFVVGAFRLVAPLVVVETFK